MNFQFEKLSVYFCTNFSISKFSKKSILSENACHWLWSTRCSEFTASVQFREHQASCQSQPNGLQLFSAVSWTSDKNLSPLLPGNINNYLETPLRHSSLSVQHLSCAGRKTIMHPTQKRSESDRQGKDSIRCVNTKYWTKKPWNSVGYVSCQSLCFSTLLFIKPVLWVNSHGKVAQVQMLNMGLSVC